MAMMATKVRVRWYPRRGCPDCDGGGWKPSAGDPRRFVRCTCWRRYEFGGAPRQIPDGKMMAAEGRAE